MASFLGLKMTLFITVRSSAQADGLRIHIPYFAEGGAVALGNPNRIRKASSGMAPEI